MSLLAIAPLQKSRAGCVLPFWAWRQLGAIVLSLVLVLCLVGPCLPDQAFAAEENKADFGRLFGRVSLRRPLKIVPFWTQALDRDRKNPIFVDDKVLHRRISWAMLKKGAESRQGIELLRYVNNFWNGFPYIEDIRNWKKEDYWAAPYEFVKRSGDCEDYAIAKYLTFRELGIAASDMRIVVVQDTFRGMAHAVLAFRLEDAIYILDNVSNAIVTHGRLSQYEPEFAVNEDGAWMYMATKKTKKKK